MTRLPSRPDLPPSEKILATAVRYLKQGNEEEPAALLSLSSLELSEPIRVDGVGFTLNITLRSDRQVLEKILGMGRPAHPPPPVLRRIREAIAIALPCDCEVGILAARAAPPGFVPYQLDLDFGQVPEPEYPPSEPEPPPLQPESQPLLLRNVFERHGDLWRIVFDGGHPFHITDCLGAKYLDYLLRRPGESIAAFDLETTVCPEKGEARSRNSIQQQNDSKAIRSYLAELNRLRSQREGAAEEGDQGKVAKLDRDIEAIESVLSGKACAADVGERARNNVRKVVGRVRRRLLRGNEQERAFGEHIRDFISLGYTCAYNPPQGFVWQ